MVSQTILVILLFMLFMIIVKQESSGVTGVTVVALTGTAVLKSIDILIFVLFFNIVSLRLLVYIHWFSHKKFFW